MRFATIEVDGVEQAAIAAGTKWVPLHRLDSTLRGDLRTLISATPTAEQLAELRDRAETLNDSVGISRDVAIYKPPYRHPRMIWGIGLNYSEHAQDLDEGTPEQPASFIKADHTVIGPGDDIVIPRASRRTTAEAELGLIIGGKTSDVDEASALGQLFGVCPILDQTAEDILALNPRYLTRSKNFPTFFSFGPEVVTLDELPADLSELVVSTVIDGAVLRENTVANMTHSPAKIVSFHSQMMPLEPGDIISTGTPGAGVLRPGIRVEARIAGLSPLRNTVVAEQALAGNVPAGSHVVPTSG